METFDIKYLFDFKRYFVLQCNDFIMKFVDTLTILTSLPPLLPIQDMVADYRARLKEVNARPIKKIAEAKARKRQRSLKRMEKLRKKAEAIGETVDISEKEKMNQIKQ